MLSRCLKPVLAAAFLLALFGCGKEESDNTLVDIAIGQEKQGKEIAKLTAKIGGLERLLAEIRELARKGSHGPGQARPGGTPVDFRNTAQYEQMAAAILAIQQQLNTAQSDVAATKEVLEKRPELMTGSPRRRLGSSIRNRQDLSDKLGSIVQRLAETVGDPSLRQSLMAEVEQFKQELSDDRPATELYQPLLSDLTERLESEPSGPLKDWGEKCLKALESASEDSLARRVQEGTDFQNLLRLRDLINNSIPRDLVKDVGLDHLMLMRTNDDGMGHEMMSLGPMGLAPEGRTDRGGGSASGGARVHSSGGVRVHLLESSSTAPSPIESNP